MIEKLLGLDKKMEIAGKLFSDHPPMCQHMKDHLAAMCEHYMTCLDCEVQTTIFCSMLMKEIPLLYTYFDNPQHLTNKIKEGIQNLWQQLQQQKMK
jgi:hypothetical protein